MTRGIFFGVACLVAVGTAGCLERSKALDMQEAPGDAIGRVNATPDNAILAVGGTVQIAMSAASLTGVPLTTVDSVSYRNDNLSDTLTVRVSAAGLVTGVAPTKASVPVDMVVFRGTTFNADQILVTVTPTAVAGLTLSIHPSAGDSAKLASGTVKTITPVLRNPTTGQSLTGIGLQYAVSPSDEVRVGVFAWAVKIRNLGGAASPFLLFYSPFAARNQIVPYVAEGTAWIHANVNAYGTLLQDSVLYSFTYPYTGSINVTKNNLAVLTAVNAGTATSAAVSPSVTLTPGATVTFQNGVAAADPMTVTFTLDNPVAATAAVPPSTIGGSSGNVTTLTGGQSSKRVFLTPGTYHWTWVSVGGLAPWTGQTSTGAIIIK